MIPIILLMLAVSAAADVVIFTENFETSPAIRNDGNSMLGGNATNSNHREIGFGEWAGPVQGNGNATLTTDPGFGNVLELDSGNSNRRGAGIILDPNDFMGVGAGIFTLSFDVSSYVGATGNGIVSIWAGSNYNLVPGSTNSSRVGLDVREPGTGQLRLRGMGASGTASELANATFAATGTQSLSFTYDGTSAVALIFGSEFGPEIHIDNLSISNPEPTSALLFGILCSLVFRRRRRLLSKASA